MDEEPPVKIYRRIDIPELLSENRNLKRLLNLVKNHIFHDEILYKEIKEAIK